MFWVAEAVGGGVLIPEGHRGDTVETEAQSFVVPVANGIQLETRRRNRRLPADESTTAGDVSTISRLLTQQTEETICRLA